MILIKYQKGSTFKNSNGTITNKFINKNGDQVIQVKTKDGKYYEKLIKKNDALDTLSKLQGAVKPEFLALGNARAETKKEEKQAKQKFLKKAWSDYDKWSTVDKASDRVGAFLNDPFGMTSRALLGEQAYIPGMAQGLHNFENPEIRNRYLKELGYTPGEFDASDVQNIINPGYWASSFTENSRKGNIGTAVLDGALMFLPHLPKGTISRSNIRSGANMLKNDVAKEYNKVATGNSFLTDMGVPAWKIEKPNQSIFGTGKDLRTYIAKNATDREAELYTKFGQGMHNLTPEDWAEFEALTKSGATDFTKVNTPISRIPLYYNSSEQAWDEARKLLNLKRGQIYKTPSNKSIRTWSAGIPKGYSAERIARSKPEQKIRLVIPSRYTKNLGNEFAAMLYHDPKVKFVYNENGTINLNAASENELMGNIPGGFKVIGKSAEDGMNNLIIKPVNNSNLFSNILEKLNKRIKNKSTNKQIFKSEIDWSKWNKEISENEKLMREYHAIEQQAKADGTWMKNPDGSDFVGSKLTQEEIIAHPKLANNITNEEIAKMQFLQQRSENFKKAFGNSKLVNPDGSPTIQYHGSAKKFDFFDESKFQLGDSGYSGRGIYTTPNKSKAKGYALSSKSIHKDGNYEPTIYELYGQGNNPISSEELINQNKNYDLFNFHRATDWRGNVPLEEQMLNYDVAIRNQTRGIEKVLPWNQANELVFPTNKQLKSAVGNNGMFDMTNPNIYKVLAPITLGSILYNKNK